MKRVFFLITIALVIVSCSKDTRPDESLNWWFRSELAPKGVKSIEFDGSYVEKYNRDGRLATFESAWIVIENSYNSDGFIVKKKETEYSEGAVSSTTITEYEYNNPGKFIPVPYEPGVIYQIYNTGLIPNLSKISINDSKNGNTVIEFVFSGDTMTMTTAGEKGGPYNPVEVEYRGNYPYQCNSGKYFVGPITYQENGMFETYCDGRIEDGKTIEELSIYYMKNHNDAMLIERTVDDNGSLRSEETFTYDTDGNLILQDCVTNKGKPNHRKRESTYEFDSKGNWIKITTELSYYWDFSEEWISEGTLSSERIIKYY